MTPLSTGQLVPSLTALDERVLRVITDHGPITTDEVIQRLYPVKRWTSAGASPEQAREVTEILHGLERIGRVHTLADTWHAGPAPQRRGGPDR